MWIGSKWRGDPVKALVRWACDWGWWKILVGEAQRVESGSWDNIDLPFQVFGVVVVVVVVADVKVEIGVEGRCLSPVLPLSFSPSSSSSFSLFTSCSSYPSTALSFDPYHPCPLIFRSFIVLFPFPPTLRDQDRMRRTTPARASSTLSLASEAPMFRRRVSDD
ncbi:hypothetical protein DFJ43DRAFT_846821 [Lentinula guzmanii]|uniref:Uncharacterized protein n=1 Tax=Lentinula guzmanii TaxID=2804957 RepID=A0AA38J8W3_9AGAR|nr:hypothetical protein DFJ43DRAFT_846821 [Lentinula guzmanii]